MTTPTPSHWPFPIVNSQRTPESQALLGKRHPSNVELERKRVLAEAEEALF